MKEWDAGVDDNDQRWAYGRPPTSNANFAWLQHMIWHLAPNGFAGVVLANMSLASNDQSERSIRKALVDNDIVDCIVNLPDKLFTSTPIGACIWILNKNKANSSHRNRCGEILFIDASRLYEPISRTLNRFPDHHRNTVVDQYLSWKKNDSGYEDIPDFCKAVKVEKVKSNDYSLFPAAYIDHSSVTSDSVGIDLLAAKNKEVVGYIDNINDKAKSVFSFMSHIAHDLDIDGKEYRLGEILLKSTERLGDRDEPEVLTCTETAGLVFQKDRFAKRVATEDTSNYKLVRKTDIVYNPYLLWAGAIDQCWLVDEGITSPAYEVFRVRDEFDPVIVGALMKTEMMLKKYDGISIGTVKRRRRAPPEKFLELTVMLPDMSFQKSSKIESLKLQEFISYLDSASRALKELKITTYRRLLERLK